MKDEYAMETLQKQKVLFFTRTMGLGGTENVVLQLCEIFKPLVNSIVVCSCGGVNVEKLDEMGIKHYSIPDIENKSISTMFAVCNTIKTIVKEEKITIIHTHHRMAAFYVSLLGLYRKCKFINTSHNTFKNKKLLTRFAYRHASLIACGEMVKKNLVEYYGLSENQVTVIHNAVKPFDGNIVYDEFIRELHDEGNYIIGNVGRLSEQKGMEYFIQAIPYVISKHPNTKFVIAGSGEDETKLKQLSKDLRVEECLTFLGYRNDIQNIMSQLDLIVLSSLWEGLPLTPIEAFSVGKTIIATSVDGTPEVVKDMDNGLLIEPRKNCQIAEKINWMLENPDEKSRMENNALRTFEKEFSIDSFRDLVINYYKKLER